MGDSPINPDIKTPESLEDSEEQRALSVSAAILRAKGALEDIVLTLVGEVSELSNKPGYKAVYFTVKDDKASLPCMMWMNRYQASGVSMEVGSLVELTGRFTLWAAKGRMNFDVFSLKLAGEGRLRMQVAELARRLEAEGLMAAERKRRVPAYPEAIGLVTSPRGAAVHDVLRTLRRRYPLARIALAGVPVEGSSAPAGLIQAMQRVCESGAEVLLLVRGGGSFEDLMPFNNEQLARAIAACPIPVVTGIGHEPDTSIADMVADLRASTPTGAAEAVSPKKENLSIGFSNAAKRLSSALGTQLSKEGYALESLSSRPVMRDPNSLFAESLRDIDALGEQLTRALPQNIERGRIALARRCDALSSMGASLFSKEQHQLSQYALGLRHKGDMLTKDHARLLALLASRLNDLSPLAILARGYAIARDKDRSLVRSLNDVSVGDRLSLQLSDGELDCLVQEKEMHHD